MRGTDMNALLRLNRRSASRLALHAMVLACTTLGLASCNGGSGGGKLATPTLVIVKVPDLITPGAWLAVSAPFEVLPTKGRGVQVLFTAPVGSVFTVSLRAPNGSVTPLTENTGTQPPADAGYFQIVTVDPAQNPPTYTMYVRAPQALPDPVNIEILVVNHTLRTDSTDSDPLSVSLRKKKIFTVSRDRERQRARDQHAAGNSVRHVSVGSCVDGLHARFRTGARQPCAELQRPHDHTLRGVGRQLRAVGAGVQRRVAGRCRRCGDRHVRREQRGGIHVSGRTAAARPEVGRHPGLRDRQHRRPSRNLAPGAL